MSGTGDDVPEMPLTALLDDRAIDALIDGEPVAAWAEPLAVFAARVRAAGEGRPPRPSPALARLLAGGLAPDGAAPATEPLLVAVPVQRGAPASRRRLVASRVAGIGLVAKVAIGATAAAAGVIGAGAAGILPGSAGRVVRDAIEFVTPVEFHDDEGPAGGGKGVSDREADGDQGVDEPGEHGDTVSSDATGEADGQHGVDGQDVADTAPGAENRPTDPGRSGTAGQPGDHGEPSSTSVTLPPWAPGQSADPRPPADPGPPPSTPTTDPNTQTTPSLASQSTDGTDTTGQ